MGDREAYELTETLLAIGSDAPNTTTLDQVFRVAYDELHRIARRLMRTERPDHTLQATALLNEAYLRLANDSRLGWQSRAHFFAIAARAMRQILTEHARRRSAAKRGGGWHRVTLDDHLSLGTAPELEILDLEAALTRLGDLDERMARVVELRFYGGLTTTEVAHVLRVSRRTIQHDWRVAKMWLRHELSDGGNA